MRMDRYGISLPLSHTQYKGANSALAPDLSACATASAHGEPGTHDKHGTHNEFDARIGGALTGAHAGPTSRGDSADCAPYKHSTACDAHCDIIVHCTLK